MKFALALRFLALLPDKDMYTFDTHKKCHSLPFFFRKGKTEKKKNMHLLGVGSMWQS
jgi:hypothetical protein